MSDEATKPGAPDAKEIVDKIADAAPSVQPSDLAPGNALGGLKKVDQTILRLNKSVTKLHSGKTAQHGLIAETGY